MDVSENANESENNKPSKECIPVDLSGDSLSCRDRSGPRLSSILSHEQSRSPDDGSVEATNRRGKLAGVARHKLRRWNGMSGLLELWPVIRVLVWVLGSMVIRSLVLVLESVAELRRLVWILKFGGRRVSEGAAAGTVRMVAA